MLVLNSSSHALFDARPAASCTSLLWLTDVLYLLNLIGPASEYVCHLSQPYLLTRYTSVHYHANICALKKEQDPGWGGSGAEHGTLCRQCSQSSVLHITIHLLMGTSTEHCIPETSHQSPCTTELHFDQHSQQEPQHWVGLPPPIVLSNMCIVLTTQHCRCSYSGSWHIYIY